MHLKYSGQDGRQLARTLKKIKRSLAGNWYGSSTVVGVAVRGDLGWKKLEERREENKLLFG